MAYFKTGRLILHSDPLFYIITWQRLFNSIKHPSSEHSPDISQQINLPKGVRISVNILKDKWFWKKRQSMSISTDTILENYVSDNSCTAVGQHSVSELTLPLFQWCAAPLVVDTLSRIWSNLKISFQNPQRLSLGRKASPRNSSWLLAICCSDFTSPEVETLFFT